MAQPPGRGVSLRALGFDNGPDFVLPADVRLVEAVDQPNVVTLVMDHPAAAELAAWARAGAARTPWRVTADGGGSVVFATDTSTDAPVRWEGAFTAGSVSALTFRRVA